MSDEREQILEALYRFIAQRPGMDPRNYGDHAGYRQELRQVTNDRHHAEKLLGAIRWRTSIDADKLKEALKRAFSGRLSPIYETKIGPKTGVKVDIFKGLEYCTGQYFATEYRKAVCAVCASALWDYWREGGGTGDSIRKSARKEFGATIAGRYFR